MCVCMFGICAYVCLGICAFVCSVTLPLVLLRQGLSLDPELGQWPANPIDTIASSPHGAGLTDTCVDSQVFYVGSEI